MSWLEKKCVVVPTDFSEESIRALDIGINFVSTMHDLHVVHVTQAWSEHDIGGTWGAETEEERFQSINKFMTKKLEDVGYGDAQTAIRMGSAPVEIVRYSEEVKAELIVLPSHGRTGIKHFALGSVAERVVRMAHCPVLVMKNGHHEHGDKKKKIISYD